MNYSRKYIIFFSVLVLSIGITQGLIHYSIHLQKEDARLINISGRQRMLSQNISKTALLVLNEIHNGHAPEVRQGQLKRLAKDWREKHRALTIRDTNLGLGGENSQKVEDLFKEIQPYFEQMDESIHLISNGVSQQMIAQNVTKLIDNEPAFLKLMDTIVFQYNQESNDKLKGLQQIEIVVAIVTIIVVLLELIYLIFPVLKDLVRQNQELDEKNSMLANHYQKLNFQKAKILEQNGKLELKNEELRIAKEKAETATLAKSNFLSNMSHEIRTPMNAVLGITNILLVENPTNEQKEHLKTLHFAAENLLVIINDILDYSKIEAGKLSLEKINFNLKNTLQGIYKTLVVKAKQKYLQFRLNMDEALPEYVIGDPVRLTQILTNLVGNAVKFTEEGYVSVEVRLLEETTEEVRLFFAVEDSGIGISEEKQKVIFDSFSQADTNMTRLYGGTGLGLSISKKLIELHGSQIKLESKLGKGSKFHFSLRLPKGITPQPTIGGTNISFKLRSFKGNKKILLVDDNHLNIKVAERFLKYWKLEFDIAYHGQEALDLLQQKDYHLVLMDLQMPIMDGYTAVKTIRAWKDPKYKVLPIVALSASAIAEFREKAFQIGMNDYLMKPFKPNELFEMIERHLVAN